MVATTTQPLILHPPANFQEQFSGVVSLARQLSLKYVHRYVVTEQDLQSVGGALWQTLAADEALGTARNAAGTQILPLIVESADPLVQSLPWECLHHPDQGFLGKQAGFTLSRRLPVKDTPAMSLPSGPLKVLLFTSLPDDLDQEKERLDVETEQAHVLEALDPLIRDGLVELTTPDDGRVSHFRGRLQEEFHLVFLSGHGEFRHEPLSHEPPRAVFLFEGEDGRGDPVEGSELAQAFMGTTVQAVVLSACQSGKSASDELSASLTVKRLETGLPHVIGMRESILDVAGRRFAQALCAALGRQERLDVALQEAREAIAQPLDLAGARRDAAKEGTLERTWGQWCLPLLYSREPGRSLIDWNFTPEPPLPPLLRYEELAGLPLPETFIGRRRELRELGRQLFQESSRQCLITGAGGQGKTSLAGRLAQRLEHQGYRVRAYTARQERPWADFVVDLTVCLAPAWREQVDRQLGRLDALNQARLLIRALLQQEEKGLVLVLDNLETVQDPATGKIADPAIATWLEACQPGAGPGPLVLLTSRWVIPDWVGKGRFHHHLGAPPYGDFLRQHQQRRGVRWESERLRRLYRTLDGNFKGLELFHGLSQTPVDEEAFLQQLEQAQAGLQLYMAVEKLVGYLQAHERELLKRLRAYLAPVNEEGVQVIARDLNEPQRLLRRLTGLSLVDVEFDTGLRLNRYRLSPVVGDWLEAQGEAPTLEIRQRAARYQRWVFRNLQPVLEQALMAHEALRQSGLDKEAARLALDFIVPRFSRGGLYHTLLKEWLPDLRESQDRQIQAESLNISGKICIHVGQYDEGMAYLEQSLGIRRAIGDRAGEGTTLNNIAGIYHAKGDYDTALEYLEQSLGISRAIGDRAGLCVTLFNRGHMHLTNKQPQEGIATFVAAYRIARDIGWAEALQNLDSLAKQMGGDGLQMWEHLAQPSQPSGGGA